LLGTIKLPDDPANQGLPYPYGFDIAPDGSFWVAQPNSGNVVHVDPSGHLIASYPVGFNPEWVAFSQVTGHVAVTASFFSGGLFDLDPSNGNVTFHTEPIFIPAGLNFTPSGDLWASDFIGTLTHLDRNYNVLQQFPVNGEPSDTQADANGNVWAALSYSFVTGQGAAFRYDASGNQQFDATISGVPVFQTVVGAEFPNAPAPPPPDLVDVYSFHLDANQSATAVIGDLSGGHAQFVLEDAAGDVLAQSNTGAANYDAGLNNFVARTSGTYYLVVTGDSGVHYELVVTRGADFATKPNNSLAQAQDITATRGDGQGGALGIVRNSLAAPITIAEGTDFLGSNCGCYPPDPNAAVGDGYVAEAVNAEFRVYDESGNLKLDESFYQFFFGLKPTSLTDPYVEYDAQAGRWYVTMLDLVTRKSSDFLFAVSNDSNPLGGFSLQQRIHIGDFDQLDFDKMGYNYDAVILEANDIQSTETIPVQFVAIDKAQLLTGNFVDYTYPVVS
jgi:hypothetical protein